jgi:hypothetical protein
MMIMPRTLGRKRLFLAALALLAVFSAPVKAFAACSSPAGNAGDVFYSSTSTVMVYCNGTNWIAMGSSAAVSYGTLTTNDFCVATSGTAIACTTVPTGTGNVVLSSSPTLTGTLAGVNSTWTGQIAVGTTTLSGALNVSGTVNATTFAGAYTGSGASLTGIGTASLGGITGTPSSTTYLRGDGTWAAAGGTGTVSSGTQYQMAYYAANGTVVSGNSKIVTDSSNNLNINTAYMNVSNGYITLTSGYGIFASTGMSELFWSDHVALTYSGTERLTVLNGGQVGIGSAAPTATLTVNGTHAFQFAADYSTATATQSDVALNAASAIRYTGAGSSTFYGIVAGVAGQVLYLTNAATSTYTLTLANQSGSEATAANKIITGTGADMIMANNSSVILQYDGAASRWRVIGGSGGATLSGGTTNEVPLWTSATTLGTSNIYQSSGNIGIGSATPMVSLDLSQKTDALALPAGTTGQRPTCSSTTNGVLRYNSTLPALEACVNSAWVSVGAGGGQLLGVYSSGSSATNYSVVFTGTAGSVPSFSGSTLTLASNTAYIVVELWGGGAGGGGSGNSGMTGGAAGGTSYFGTNNPASTSPIMTAAGGSADPTAYNSGTGGTGTGGDENLTGSSGVDDIGQVNGGNLGLFGGGSGGSAPRGGGGAAGPNYSGAGVNGNAYGGGGSGGGETNIATGVTGTGGAGGGYAKKFINSPSGTYYFTVGGGGSGGSAGSNGLAGGSGGAGGITIAAYSSGSSQAFNIATQASGVLPVANGGTGVTSSTGTGSVVLSASPTHTGTVTGVNSTWSGTVGIGTTAPTTPLEIHAATDTNLRFGTAAALYGGTGFSFQAVNDAHGAVVPLIIQGNPTAIMQGNVGIGTTSPTNLLHVNNTSGTLAGLRVDAVAATGGNGGGIVINTTSASNHLMFEVGGVQKWVQYVNGTDLRFYSGGDKVTITNGGNVGIGTTAPAFDGNTSTFLAVNAGSNSYGEIGIGASVSTNVNVGGLNFYNSALGVSNKRIAGIWSSTGSANNSGDLEFYTYNAGTQNSASILISSTGAIFMATMANSIGDSNVCFSTTTKQVTYYGASCIPSDMRLKKNIVTLNNALDKVTQMRGVTFNWKDPQRGTEQQVGVVAQEIEKIYPQLVVTDSNGTKGVSYDRLTGPLIEAVKELKSLFDTDHDGIAKLKAANAAQEAEIKALTARVDKLEAAARH